MNHLSIPERDRRSSGRHLGFGARPARRDDDGMPMHDDEDGFALTLEPSTAGRPR